MLTFSDDKSQSNIYIYIANGFRISTNALFRIFSVELCFIYSAYLILLVRLGESLGAPNIFTLFIRFCYTSDDG